jgi:hypothetical protein
VTEHSEHQIVVQLASLRTMVETGFVETHRRMDHANARLDSMDAALRKTQERVAEHGVRIETDTKAIAEQWRVIDGLRQNLHALEPLAALARQCMEQLGVMPRRGRRERLQPGDEAAESDRAVTRWDVKLVMATIAAVATLAMAAWQLVQWWVHL